MAPMVGQSAALAAAICVRWQQRDKNILTLLISYNMCASKSSHHGNA